MTVVSDTHHVGQALLKGDIQQLSELSKDPEISDTHLWDTLAQFRENIPLESLRWFLDRHDADTLNEVPVERRLTVLAVTLSTWMWEWDQVERGNTYYRRWFDDTDPQYQRDLSELMGRVFLLTQGLDDHASNLMATYGRSDIPNIANWLMKRATSQTLDHLEHRQFNFSDMENGDWDFLMQHPVMVKRMLQTHVNDSAAQSAPKSKM